MEVKLLYNQSENNTIGKKVSTVSTVEVVAKNSISVNKPVLIITYSSNIKTANYCYISEYGRYYYIDEIIYLTGNRAEIHLSCDVLESFKNDILNLPCIIDKQQNKSKANMYLNDGSYVVQSNETNSIVSFPNGFNDNGEFILICAGG